MANLREQTIRDLVERSRLGDQVATAQIAFIADRGKRGDKTAEKVRRDILAFAKKNPVVLAQTPSMFGIESPVKEDATHTARVLRQNLGRARYTGAGLALLILSLGEYATGVLFYGPWLFADAEGPNPIIESVREALVDERCQMAFDLGNSQTNRPEVIEEQMARMTAPQKKACHLGILIGRARRLQTVALPHTPISILSTDTGWELGE